MPNGLGDENYKRAKIGGSGLFDIRARPDDLTCGESSPRRVARHQALARTTHDRPDDQAQTTHGKARFATKWGSWKSGLGPNP